MRDRGIRALFYLDSWATPPRLIYGQEFAFFAEPVAPALLSRASRMNSVRVHILSGSPIVLAFLFHTRLPLAAFPDIIYALASL